MKFLLGELTGKRPLMPPTLQTSAEQADVINTFRTIAQLPPDSLGAYVISMARSASDVLAVVLLQASSTSSTTPDCHATMPLCCHLCHSCLVLVLMAPQFAMQGCVKVVYTICGPLHQARLKCMPCFGQHCPNLHCQPNIHNRVMQPDECCLQIVQPKGFLCMHPFISCPMPAHLSVLQHASAL